MILSTPLPLPELKPDDWNKWWSIWDSYSSPLIKITGSVNKMSGLHVGFDVYKTKGYQPIYEAPFVDLEQLYPSLYNQIVSLPVKIYCARFVTSRGDFPAHRDNHLPNWSIRSMFYCRDTAPQWYYTDITGNDKKYLSLPPDTNWWAYYDGYLKHGTDYRADFPKIILQVFTPAGQTKQYIDSVLGHYPEYCISYDNI